MFHVKRSKLYMRADSVIAYFHGTVPTARRLGLSRDAVQKWGELVPPEIAMRAWLESDGELFLDPAMYRDWPRRGRVRDRGADRRIKRNRIKQEKSD
jgi:hypothetical protein